MPHFYCVSLILIIHGDEFISAVHCSTLNALLCMICRSLVVQKVVAMEPCVDVNRNYGSKLYVGGWRRGGIMIPQQQKRIYCVVHTCGGEYVLVVFEVLE